MPPPQDVGAERNVGVTVERPRGKVGAWPEREKETDEKLELKKEPGLDRGEAHVPPVSRGNGTLCALGEGVT